MFKNQTEIQIRPRRSRLDHTPARLAAANMDDSFEDEHGEPPLTPRERELPRDNLGLGEGYQTVRPRPAFGPRRRDARELRRPADALATVRVLTSAFPASRHAQAQSKANDAALPTPTPLSPVRMGALDDAPAPSATSPSRPSAEAQLAAPMSPPQAAAAAAAAVAAAAATAAAEVARQSIELTRSREFESASEFVPPGTPLRDALLDAPEVADVELDRDLEPEFHGFGDHPVQPEPTVSSGDGAGPGPDAADAGARDPPVSETHFLRKDGGNQPAVMNSIAGLFGLAGGASSADAAAAAAAAEEASRDAAFEEALERVRQSRRDIADKAAKGFSDMKAYYEAELRNAKTAAEGDGAPDGADVPLSVLARPRGFAWDLDETALRRALPTEGELLALRAQQDEQRASVERVWPEPWKGSYSPPNEENAEPAPAPYPLAEAFVETADRAPADPPDVAYPTEAAEAAARRAEAVAAKISVAAADANADARADAEAEKEGVAEGRASPPIHASASALQSAAASESTQLAKRVKALQGDLAAAERREKHAERVADDAERRCEALASELKEAKGKAQARDAEARELGRAVAVLKTGAEEAKAESVDVARRLTSATSTNARLASEAKAFHARRATLERENGALAAEVQDLKRENAGLKNGLGRAEDTNERLRERLGKTEEAFKVTKRDLERATRDAEAARREARASKARDELGARESSGLASSLRDAKSEVAEMRRRCEYLEKAADFVAAAGGSGPGAPGAPPGRLVPGRDVPASRPFSAAFRANAAAPDPKAHRRDGAAPAPRPFSSAYRDADENRAPVATDATGFFGGKDPIEPSADVIRDVNARVSVNDERRNSNGRNSSRTGITTSVLSRQGETPAAGVSSSARRGVAGGDHLGAGMVPEPGAERREAFAGEYGDEHEGKDTRDHFGSGMDVHASFEGAAAAREMASARAAAQAAARRDAEARAQAAAAGAAAEASAAAARAAETAERARLEAASAERELEKARLARAETAAARQRAMDAGEARGEVGEFATTQPAARRRETTREAPTLYSAAEASRKGREGSGWFDALGETAPAARARSNPSSAAPPPPWLLGAETESPSSGGDRITGRAAAPAARDARPFATADSFATWSSHVASAEARLMALSQERDQLEGELSRMPEGSGRTLEQRRKKANAEKRLEEVLKASSAARHQLKAANRNLGHAA